MKVQSERIRWIDIAKGIGILLVICGHSTNGGAVMGVIYSFHMPLFFILSGMIVQSIKKMDILRKRTVKDVKRLLLPWMGLTILLLPLFWKNYHSAYKVMEEIFYNRISVVWFLLVLFGMKVISYIVELCVRNSVLRNILYIALSTVGILIGKKGELPFMMDIILAALFWFVISNICISKKYIEKSFSWRVLVVSAILWGIGLGVQYILNGHMFNYFTRAYPMWPLCYVEAIMGALSVFEYSKLLSKFGGHFLDWIGRKSMILLCVHTLDAYWVIYLETLPKILFALIRVGVDVLLTILVDKVIDHMKKYRGVS